MGKTFDRFQGSIYSIERTGSNNPPSFLKPSERIRIFVIPSLRFHVREKDLCLFVEFRHISVRPFQKGSF